MKNTLRRIVVSTIIAVSTATAAIAPAAVNVMANDGYEALYDENGNKYFYNTDTCKYYYADENGNVACDENGPIEMSVSNHSDNLDYSRYGETRYAHVSDFLALRVSPSVDSTMIEALAPNTEVTIIGTIGSWAKVYVPSVDSDGYVSLSYLSNTRSGSNNVTYKKVFGTTHYLALRTATEYDDANEIAKLHDGDQVQVLDSNVNGTGYARVYVPSLDKTGYVNAEYLR